MRLRRVLSSLLVSVMILGAAGVPTGMAQESATTPTATQPGDVVLAESVATTTSSQMTLQLPEGSTDSTLRVNVVVTNTSSTVYQLDDLQPEIEIYDRASSVWPIEEVTIQYETAPIAENVTFRIDLTVANPNVLDYSGPVFLRVQNVLDDDTTVFALTFQNGETSVPTEIPVNPLNETQSPIRLPGQTQSQGQPTQQQATEPLAGSAAQQTAPRVGPLDIDAMMPKPGELPTGLWIVNEGKLSQSAIASTFTDPAMADRFLNDWGWQENAHIYLEGAPTADGITYVDIGLHRFSSETSALFAMEYYISGRAEVMGMWEIDDPELGTHGRTITNGTDTTAYAVVDSVVIRVSVAGSNPSPFTMEIRQAILAKAAAQGAAPDVSMRIAIDSFEKEQRRSRRAGWA